MSQAATSTLKKLPPSLADSLPPLLLAPMQDVTTLPFMQLIAEYGCPDWFVTEYFRVTECSRLEPHIVESIVDAPMRRPVFAQIIGENIPAIIRTIHELENLPIAGIDLNLGCPAPKVYRKNVGGGLLRDPARVDAILEAMRGATTGRLSVKMRIGFDDTRHFEDILASINRHNVDMLTVHGRTVREMYRSEVHYNWIARAVDLAACPVIANGDVSSADKALRILEQTRCHGLMAGRHAIRNPWLFRQIREAMMNQEVFQPNLGDVRAYIDQLWFTMRRPGKPVKFALGYLKKFVNFIGQSVDSEARFLKAMRWAKTADEFWRVCDEHLVADGRANLPFNPEPFPGVVARPNAEGRESISCAS